MSDLPVNLVQLLDRSVSRWAERPLFGTRQPEGHFDWVTYAQVGARVELVRGGLAALGVGRGDVVAYIGDNSPLWAAFAFATFGLGGRFVPMYERELLRIWRHIVADSGARVLVVASQAILEAVRDWPGELEALEHLVVLEGQGPGSLTELEQVGQAAPVPSIQPEPSDVAVLIYTSGTTSEPKGVLLTHDNLVRNARGGAELFPILDHTHVGVSILPWAHSFGQVADLYNFIQLGASLGIMGSPETLALDLQEVRPTFLIAVPRIFNRIHAGVHKTMRDKGGVAWFLFERGLRAAEALREGRAGLSDRLWHALADRIVFARVRERFGGRLKGVLTGSATMDPAVMLFFHDIGVPCFDAYGLTETSPAVTMNTMEAWRVGSVGRTLTGVRVEIDRSVVEEEAEDGEIVVYGHNVMKGYHNLPEQTAAVMTEDGGFRTGDRGRLDADGFLYITGRIKEQYKLANGKYVFPASIEEMANLSPWITASMLHGSGRPFSPEYSRPARAARSEPSSGPLRALA